MKRCNFPRRKDARKRAALARLKDQAQWLFNMKGRRMHQRRDTLRRVIANTEKNLGDNQ